MKYNFFLALLLRKLSSVTGLLQQALPIIGCSHKVCVKGLKGSVASEATSTGPLLGDLPLTG